MIGGKSVLAIIPARIGSRRIPFKNITLYKGRPLIEWAILHAQASRYIDTIAISSDSPQILAYATPPIVAVQRPAHLASNSASSEAVIVHTLYSTNPLGEHAVAFHDLFVLLQPTSPNRTAADIDACLELACKGFMFDSSTQTVDSITPDQKRNGAVYVSSTLDFLSSLSLSASRHYEMPFERSLDIDYPEDLHRDLEPRPTISSDLKTLGKSLLKAIQGR